MSPFEEFSPLVGFCSGRKGCRSELRFDVSALSVSFDSGIDMGIEGDEEPIGLILVKDLDSLGIVLVIKEMDILFDQFHGGFIDSSVKGDGSVPIYFTSCPGAKEVREVFGSGPQKVKVSGIAVPGCFFGGAMNGSMIGLITPLFEPFVEVGKG